jgi:ubiquinone/menaquinone biosynthesis C-methylase UbiE
MENYTPPDDRATEASSWRRITRWNGRAQRYDAFRPAAPAALPDLLTQLAGAPTAHVLDIGAGTGLATLIWASHARMVTGIEPISEIGRQAGVRLAASGSPPGVRFLDATANDTGLPVTCADIVSASQTFHWMEPESTLAEVARILRRGGVFAAYDYDWPPTITPETDLLFARFMARVREVARARGFSAEAPGWEKSSHSERIRQSGHFRLTKAIMLHYVEAGDADRFIGLILSNVVALALASDILTAKALETEAFERDVRHAFASAGPAGLRWYFSYHVRIGVI